MSIFISVILIILGFIFLIKGADFLVDGASNIAKKLHIPEIIIGLTIVSIGTSMPELLISITAALRGSSDMSMGNVIGSNVCNMLLILGVASTIKEVKFQKETRLIEIPLLLGFSFVFISICNTGTEITRLEAIFLMVLFILFIIYTIVMSKESGEFAKEEKEVFPQEEKSVLIFKSILWVALGILGLKIGGDLTVNNVVTIAEKFNLSEKIISLTILAIGTSLPELVTSVTAAVKGNSDIAIGNIIGSNIFNMLLIIGTSAIISPITYNITYNIQMAIFILSIIMLAIFPIIPPKNGMSRGNGITYLIWYAIYIVVLFNV